MLPAHWPWVIGTGCLIGFSGAIATPLAAQPITAAADGTDTVVTRQDQQFFIQGGSFSRDRANQFHSFDRFGLDAAQTATFVAPPATVNILGRVVGGEASLVNGLLQVTGAPADLYLINPAGWLFGPDARLDVPASFTATTATQLQFGSALWEVLQSNAYADLVGQPWAYTLPAIAPGAIANAGTLTVPSGQTLTLAAGTIVNTGTLAAPDGALVLTTLPHAAFVRLGAPGHALSLDLPAPALAPETLTPSTLPTWLTGGALRPAIALVPQANGTVTLTSDPTLPPLAGGDVALRGTVTAAQVGIQAAATVQGVESTIIATEAAAIAAAQDLILRDTPTQPLQLVSGGNLTLYAGGAIDIFALHQADSQLQAGGNFTLRSPQAVIGDARFTTGGNFQIQTLDGQPGSLWSPHDPVIRASGDVSLASYTGASLHILAGGSVYITGNVEITGADPAQGLVETVTLSDGRSLSIDGQNRPTLDIRAGTLAFNPVGDTGDLSGVTGLARTTPPSLAANIRIDGNIRVSAPGGLVFLTNAYQPNPAITTGLISVNVVGRSLADNTNPADPNLVAIDTSETRFGTPGTGGGEVVIDARTSVTGEITLTNVLAENYLTAGRTSIAIAGGIDTSFTGNTPAQITGGAVTLLSQDGHILLEYINTGSSNFADFDQVDPAAQPANAGVGGDITIATPRLFRAIGFVPPGDTINITGEDNLPVVSLYASGTRNFSNNDELNLAEFGGGTIAITAGGAFVSGTEPAIDPNNPNADPLTGEDPAQPDNPNAIISLRLIPAANFQFLAGDGVTPASGARGVIVSRNTNGALRSVFANQILLPGEDATGATSSTLSGSTIVSVRARALPQDPPVDPPVDPPTDPPVDPPVDPPTDPPTDPPVDPPTDPPTDPPVDPPTDPPTDSPTDPPTDAPTDSPTDPSTDPPTDAPTDSPTDSPTDPSPDSPTETPSDETPGNDPETPNEDAEGESEASGVNDVEEDEGDRCPASSEGGSESAATNCVEVPVEGGEVRDRPLLDVSDVLPR